MINSIESYFQIYKYTPTKLIIINGPDDILYSRKLVGGICFRFSIFKLNIVVVCWVDAGSFVDDNIIF